MVALFILLIASSSRLTACYAQHRIDQDSNSTLSHRIGSGVENEVLIRALPAHSSQFPSVLSPAN